MSFSDTVRHRYQADLVEDSHATGFIGKIDVITMTLGKALGGASGGCVSGRRELVEMCRQRASLRRNTTKSSLRLRIRI